MPAHHPHHPRFSSRLWVLYFAIMVAGMGQTIVFAIVPMLGRELLLDQLVVRLPLLGDFALKELAITSLTSFASMTFFFTASFWGRKSDELGRKPVVLIGLMGLALGTFLFSFMAWLGLKGLVAGFLLYLLLMFSRVTMVAVMAGVFPASNAYAIDVSTLKQRTQAISKMAVANQVGSMIGPALAYFAAISFLAPLNIQAGLALIAFLLVWFFLKPPIPTMQQIDQSKNNRLSYFDPRFRLFLLLMLCMFIALAMVQQTLGFYFQDQLKLGAVKAAQTFSYAMMVNSLATMAAQFIVVQRWQKHPIRLLQLGLPIIFVGYGLLAMATTLPVLMTGMGLFGFGMGMALPGCSVSATYTVSMKEQGALAGFNAAVPAMGFVIGPILGGWIYGQAPALTYTVAAAIILLLCFMALSLKPSWPDNYQA